MDEELLSDGDSASVDGDDSFEVESEEGQSPVEGIDPVSLGKALKDLKGLVKSYANKENPRVRGAQKRKEIGKGKSQIGCSGTAGSRCNNVYFGEIVGNLDDDKKKIIRDHGFGSLLDYDGCVVPRRFVQWLANQVDVNCWDIVVGGKVIPCSPKSVHLFLGIPIGGKDIRDNSNESATSKFLKKIDESKKPLIKTFGSKLLTSSLSEEDVVRYFLIVALSTFLCPNSNTVPSPKYFHPLLEISTVKEWDWSKFVYEWLFNSISLYRKKKRQTIGGCIYFFAAYYLDFLNFGSRHVIPETLPRILCWRGSMIKEFASYDCVSGDKFGKRPVKSIEQTCYDVPSLAPDLSASFRSGMDKCDIFRASVRDDLCSIFDDYQRKGFMIPEYGVDKLVLSMFTYMHGRFGKRTDEGPSGRHCREEDVDAMETEIVGPKPGSDENVNLEAVHPTIPGSTEKINEPTVTEPVESGGSHVASSTEICGGSEATEILPSNESSIPDSDLVSGTRKRKRRNFATECSSPEVSNTIGSRLRQRRHSQGLDKSPLSRTNIDDAQGTGLDSTPVGCTSKNPLIVEEFAEGSMKHASKFDKLKEKCTEEVILEAVNEEHATPISKENELVDTVRAALDTSGGKAPAKKSLPKRTPYFNSPSMPSFRILEDEDDLGNFVEDPKLRRPIGTGVHSEVQSEIPFNFQFCAGPKGYVVVVPVLDYTSEANIVEEEHNKNECITMESLPWSEYDSGDASASVPPGVHETSGTAVNETIAAAEEEDVTEAVPLAAIVPPGLPCATPSPMHQDVPIVHETYLSSRSHGSCDGSGFLFNQDGVEASYHCSSYKIAVHRPRRVVVPSKFKLSPYIVPHANIIVSSLEAAIYDVVLRLAESEFSDLAVIDYGHVIVKLSALGSSLKPDGKVNYFVVNALCKLLFHKRHPRTSYKHYFFSKVGDYLIGNHGPNDIKEQLLRDNAKRCFEGASRARALANSSLLYFPILFQERWYVLVVHIKRRLFVILDSWSGVDSDFHRVVRDEFVENFATLWKDVVKIDMGFHSYGIIFGNVPQQSENFDNDSGVFAMKYLELWEPNVSLNDKFVEADIPHLRIKYVSEMIFNEFNCSDDGRRKVMEYDTEVYEKYYKTA